MENKHWQDNFKENIGVIFGAIDTCQEWWKDINKLKTNWFQWNKITLKINLWERTYWQEMFSWSTFDFDLEP